LNRKSKKRKRKGEIKTPSFLQSTHTKNVWIVDTNDQNGRNLNLSQYRGEPKTWTPHERRKARVIVTSEMRTIVEKQQNFCACMID
jgi:hypothetical protein